MKKESFWDRVRKMASGKVADIVFVVRLRRVDSSWAIEWQGRGFGELAAIPAEAVVAAAEELAFAARTQKFGEGVAHIAREAKPLVETAARAGAKVIMEKVASAIASRVARGS